MSIYVETTQKCTTCNETFFITDGSMSFVDNGKQPIYGVFTCSQCDFVANEPCQECYLRDCSCVEGKTLQCFECDETYQEGNGCESCADSNRDDNANAANHFVNLTPFQTYLKALNTGEINAETFALLTTDLNRQGSDSRDLGNQQTETPRGVRL